MASNQETPSTAETPIPGSGGPEMRAITQDRYGSIRVLALGIVGRPAPEPDEVLIEVAAAGVDRGTCHLMTGTPYLIRIAGYGLTRPKNKIPGLDVAGRVVAIGGDVTRFAVGDEVFGIADGSLAEYATASEDKLAHKPANLTLEQAAVTAVSGITALQALTDVGGVEPGQHVLIVGASGGVGSFAVQLAKALGAEVSAVASTRNLDLVRSLGADHVIDYTQQDFTATGQRYDLILDIGGRNSISRLRSALAPAGTLVIVGGEDGNRITGGVGRQLRAMMLSPFVGQRLATFISTEHYSFMERLAAHIKAGEVIPAVQGRFALTDTAQAIDQLNAGRASGKSVIVIHDTEEPDRTE
jgi:NADPH:quinone reductase-like Zn-dependent oxidoreductase